MALFFGVFGAVVMANGTRAHMLVGAGLLQLSYITDNCDGALARLKVMSSPFGMWYDYMADVIVEFALWIGLARGAVLQGITPLIYWIAAAACLGSLLNFWRVILNRSKKDAGLMIPGNAILRAMHTLGRDGDPTFFVWLMAGIGYPGLFLITGCVYVYCLSLVK